MTRLGRLNTLFLLMKNFDESPREQMDFILRFLDFEEFVKEWFFVIVSVQETSAETLKEGITKVFTQYNIYVNNMHDQGYDGASNMCSSWNGLQA